MVVNGNPADFAGFNDLLRDGDVFLRRFSVFGRMIVGDDNTGSRSYDSATEDFTRVNQAAVERTFRDDFESQDFVCAVEPENDESFADVVFEQR